LFVNHQWDQSVVQRESMVAPDVLSALCIVSLIAMAKW